MTNSTDQANQTDKDRLPFDVSHYHDTISTGPCFICEFIKGNPKYKHHMVYEDDNVVAFLNKFPMLYGYVLIAPRQHLEQVISDVTLEEYLTIQKVIYRIGEALRKTYPTERLYILSLGSQQGNKHIHWHVVPLPPGVPLAQQQGHALSVEKGILALSDDEMAAMALSIRQNMV